ncbi:MAG: class I SAM-dependent methyltransferase [Magnetococcus sp. DMHC-1]
MTMASTWTSQGKTGTDNPSLNYYRTHGILPGRQQLAIRESHVEMRSSLFRHLGLPPGWLRGRTVLELGPGCGQNALHMFLQKPARLLLVDENEAALEAIRNLFAAHRNSNQPDCELQHGLIEAWRCPDQFELVFCESVIPWQQENPQGFLRKVASHVAPEGLLIITCMDSVSTLPDLLRRLAALLMVRPEDPLARQVTLLSGYFREHLASLQHATKQIDDWVLTNLLQPLVGTPLSMADAIATLDDNFDLYATSPHFVTDWRWYKQIHGSLSRWNELALAAFWNQAHNLLDCRQVVPPRSAALNQQLMQQTDRMAADIMKFYHSRDPALLPGLADTLDWVVSDVNGFAPLTAVALAEFARGLGQYRQHGRFPGLPVFKDLFGRSQQHLCFIQRRSHTHDTTKDAW